MWDTWRQARQNSSIQTCLFEFVSMYTGYHWFSRSNSVDSSLADIDSFCHLSTLRQLCDSTRRSSLRQLCESPQSGEILRFANCHRKVTWQWNFAAKSTSLVMSSSPSLLNIAAPLMVMQPGAEYRSRAQVKCWQHSSWNCRILSHAQYVSYGEEWKVVEICLRQLLYNGLHYV